MSITTEPDFNGRDRDRKRKRKRDRELPDELRELPSTTLPSLISLMRMTYEEWDEWTRGSAMRRSGYAGFRRNVAVALGNWGSPGAVPVLTAALRDLEPVVRSHAAWALGQIDSRTARSALVAAVAHEEDDSVRAEIEAAL